MPPICVRIRVDFGPGLAIGPGKIALLEGVQRTGSLAQAARDMGMSYRRAWLLMQSLNEAVREPVTVASTGGRHGGGATITAAGKALLASYRRLERKVLRDARKEMASHLRAQSRKPAPVRPPRLSRVV